MLDSRCQEFFGTTGTFCILAGQTSAFIMLANGSRLLGKWREALTPSHRRLRAIYIFCAATISVTGGRGIPGKPVWPKRQYVRYASLSHESLTFSPCACVA